MKVQLDLDKYPELKALFESDKAEFAKIVNGMMVHADKALIKERFTVSKNVYGRGYIKMLDEVMNAFFNPMGIADKHYNDGEKAGLRSLGMDLHPLSIFTNDVPVYNAKGQNISPAEWIGQEEFDLEDWLYALFYGARFVSWQELSEYISLGQYELIDILKARNFNELRNLQGDLQKQEDKGIPKGKLIPGTGELDTGIILREK